MVRVVQNLARRRLRDDRRRTRRHEAVMPPDAPAASDDLLAQAETHRLVAETVQQLQANHRRVLVLRFWHDLPPRAIARQLGLPVATVKSQLQRGLQELRERLDARTGERRAWLGALVPLAFPRLGAATAGGTTLPLFTTLSLAIAMKQFVLLLLAGIGIGLGLWFWQPWGPPASEAWLANGPQPVPAANGQLAGDSRPARDDGPVVQPGPVSVPALRSAAENGERSGTIVGRIVGDTGAPVTGARLQLVPAWHDARLVERTVDAADDGNFAAVVSLRNGMVPYRFALAVAPGWAVREVELDLGAMAKPAAGDRIDLGTLVLERGVAVAGRVLEADGSPLASGVRLLAFDPARLSSSVAMWNGRTVGFAAPGGEFALAERVAATSSGRWVLAAIGAGGVGWVELAFAAGETRLAPVELRLLPGASLSVRVVDADGQPIDGAEVQTVPHFLPIGLAPMWPAKDYGAHVPALDEATALLRRRSDAAGRVRFDHLPLPSHASIHAANQQQPPVPGMLVTASHPGFPPVTCDAVPGGDGNELVLTLQRLRPVTFHGTVSTRDGQRLAGVRVQQLGALREQVVTDQAGRYELTVTPMQGDKVWFELGSESVPRTMRVVELAAGVERVEQHFLVALRAPVQGRVVDDRGVPVEGVALYLGAEGGMYAPSTPKRTAADGRFVFPNATTDHDHLRVEPGEPASRFHAVVPRKVQRRDDELVVLQRRAGVLAELRLTLVDGNSGAPVSPTAVELIARRGSVPAGDYYAMAKTLALGRATFAAVPPGSYRAIVRAGDDRAGELDFEVPAVPQHEQRIAVWTKTAILCTIDTSALTAEQQVLYAGETVLVSLVSDSEQSVLVDSTGAPRDFTPNTGVFQFGGELTFRLERVTPNVPRRLRVLHTTLFGEVWFTAAPGAVTPVTLALVPSGRIVVKVPADWPAGVLSIERHDGSDWALVDGIDFGAAGSGEPRQMELGCAVGELRWRLRYWPVDGAPVREREGTSTVAAGVSVALEWQ